MKKIDQKMAVFYCFNRMCFVAGTGKPYHVKMAVVRQAFQDLCDQLELDLRV